MKLILFTIALFAIAAAGFTGFNAKTKYESKVKERNDLTVGNATQSKNISTKEGEKTSAEAAEKLALEEKAKANAELEAAKSKATELANTLDSVSGDLEVAAAEKKKIDASMEALRGKFPGIELEEVPRVVKDMETGQKKLVGEEQDASLVKKRLEEDIAKNLAESSRIVEKINQSIKRVEGNTFQATDRKSVV